jgi:hypothetical protein
MLEARAGTHRNVIFRIGAYHTRSSNFQERLLKRPRAGVERDKQIRSTVAKRPPSAVWKERCCCRTRERCVPTGGETKECCINSQVLERDSGTDVFPSYGVCRIWRTPFLLRKQSRPDTLRCT